MSRNRRLLAVAAIVLLPGETRAETFRLTTLEWCPYTCPSLPGGGATTEILRTALGSQGHGLEVDILPWKRAVQLARRDPSLAGYYPEYSSASLGSGISPPIGHGPLGIAERRDHPLRFQTVADLSGHRLGTVEGYLNTPALDAGIASGLQPAESTVSDLSNLLKLGAGRIDGAVIDGRVMAYLMAFDPALRPTSGRLLFNSVILEEKTLHVVFSPSGPGMRMAEVLTAGLGTLDVRAAQASYFRRNGIDLDALVATTAPVSDGR